MKKCVKLIINKNYNEMHGQQNVKFCLLMFVWLVVREYHLGCIVHSEDDKRTLPETPLPALFHART
jgi:hypothetical protein